MHVEKEIAVAAPPERVWAFLWDVERVARCLPGCEDAKALVPHERYEAVMAQRVGPFKVRFPLDIRVVEAEPPRRLRAEAAGRDAGMASGVRVLLDLRVEGQDAGSRLLITTDVEISGKLGTLAQGVIQQRTDANMAQFAEAMRRELEAWK
jgi:carbon monoxide dehydrogenase subunit G